MFETEYQKIRALIFIIILMLIGLSLAQLGQSVGLYQLGKSQGTLIEALKQGNDNANRLIEILKKARPSAPKDLRYHVEPRPPGAPTFTVPTPTPGNPTT